MSGLWDKTIGSHKIAERIEDLINFPSQCKPALARDPAQISGYRLSFSLQDEKKEERSHCSNRRMKKARQPRHDSEDHPQRGCVMKAVLVPTRHFPPAIMRSPMGSFSA
jgi:hypothetical protein